jgi:hypothetical protein
MAAAGVCTRFASELLQTQQLLQLCSTAQHLRKKKKKKKKLCLLCLLLDVLANEAL